MRNRAILLLQTFLLAVFSAAGADTGFEPWSLEGQTLIHDPSTIVRDGTNYYIFGTGPGLRAKLSADLIYWQNRGPVFQTPPAWTTNEVPQFHGDFWAPDVVRVHGKFFLYYAVSSMGKQTSAIGLASNDTLEYSPANHPWHDEGAVIASTNGGAYNTIDPSAFLDLDGKLWLAFGSYWEGIYLTELDPQTGLRAATNGPLYHLAWNNSIEAACLTRHGGYYYLFVNWGQCCQGTNSTYEVRVGRAEKIIGPYRDRDGNDLVTGGGSPFLRSSGRYFGPGHIGILSDGATNGPSRFSYHYYDGDTGGRSRLGLGTLDWTDGWPVATNDLASNWKLVWADEFNTNGRPDPANWNFEHGFQRNHELQWYQPENAFCTNGLLVIEARREHQLNPEYATNGGDWRTKREWIDYTSASLTTRRLREFKYGKFEMRARIDTRPGSWPAFWTLGATPGVHWPACGEVDIMEYYNGTVLANFGYGLDGKTTWSENFHTWTMEWDEKKMDLLLDGELMNHLAVPSADKANEGNPFYQPVYLLLNQAIGGDSGGNPAETDFPVRYEIDWVRVYQHSH
jgi:arabinan endo-1,5-alpha-L-arabinosidase